MKMNNKGFTLVEVIAGFTLLVVLMVSFAKIVKLSTELTNSATDLKSKTNDFYKSYYNGMNYMAENNKPAFRISKNSANNLKISIEINEFNFENGEKTISDTYQLPKVHLKIIENINDKKIARLAIYRYVRD